MDAPSSDAPVVGGKGFTRILRWVALLVGLTGLLGSLLMLAMGLYARVSVWSVAYIVAMLLLAFALVVTQHRWRRWLLAGAGAVLCTRVISRTVTARPTIGASRTDWERSCK